ncbi:uncharacterized protein NECHADRAFT_102381 [Fusarium vanettenii 77-13-4]|uniref:DUF7053 domain-containing protein n=1 Tax=Fusarium vanettenii (strain ATCC MYA-4622 / CBS 123669 / FGSC 9596 / NRRL 45880 / 77-13-4) TaxID=660122 RepID=C7YHN4_FUSV7|nr:uncharacterized protein NECHADRAFT_102381 [Fusarium vanettenii 77-13-4]EEU48668.1 hypothetical protein NECHADRAFT_102381 [Fusarium vanettenii 77-13-4]
MFRTTAQIRHVSAIPAGIPPSKGVEMLHDHEFFIKCDPHMIKFEALQTPQDPAPAPPPGGQPVVASPKCYSITDRVHALPAGLWDSDVVSNAEFFNLESGVFIRMRGPMGMVLETVWQIEEAEDGRCEIVEDVVIACSRLLVGVVKGSCEDGWKGVHGKMVERLKGSS